MLIKSWHHNFNKKREVFRLSFFLNRYQNIELNIIVSFTLAIFICFLLIDKKPDSLIVDC
jgi:hypothetical protein